MSQAYTLETLRSFLKLCDTLSFSTAARELGLSQPSISRHIRQLEEELCVTLFVRDRHQVHLSKEGERLRLKLGPLFGEMESVLDAFKTQRDALSGTVVFGCLTELGQSTFMPELLLFAGMHPELILDVRYMREVDLLSGLKNGALDFGVLTEETSAESLRLYNIGQETSVLVTRGSNLRPLDAETEWIAYRQDDPLLSQYLKKFYARRARALRFRAIVNSHKSMKDALLACDAFAVMPSHSVSAELATGSLRLASPRELSKKLFLACQDSALSLRRNAQLKAFLLRGAKGTGL